MKHEIRINSKDIFLFFLLLCVIFLGFLCYHNFRYAKLTEQKISELESLKADLENQMNQLNEEISQKDATIEEQQKEISQLKNEVKRLKKELRITKIRLQDMTEKYEEAQPYQERVERGQNLEKYYNLLDDREDYTKPIVLQYLDLTTPTAPSNDNELWERGRKIYNWLSTNYDYCGDKGLRVGTTFYEFQFYSSDELLMSDNVRCGDCDDFATLFAGMMYASGVPENKVWVVCGIVPEGGHCWNWLSLSDTTYRIDGVCSQKQTIINILGLDLGIKGAYYTSTKKNVDCFSEYKPLMKMNPNGFYPIE